MVMDPTEKFSGADGVILIDGLVLEVAQEVKYSGKRDPIKRDIIGRSAPRAWDGPYEPELSIKFVQSGFDLFTAVMTDDPLTGTAVTLHAGILDPATTPELTTMTTPSCTTASRIRFTALTAAVTTPGTITIVGTDMNDAPHSETVTIPIMAIGAAVTSGTFFKTVSYASTEDYVQVGGTISIASVVGGSTATITPHSKRMTVVIQATNSKGVRGTLTITNCWPTQNDFSLTGGAKSMMEPTVPFAIADPDNDVTFAESQV